VPSVQIQTIVQIALKILDAFGVPTFQVVVKEEQIVKFYLTEIAMPIA